MELTGKNIIVTGAASGIGMQSAKLLKEKGANIIGMDRNEPADYVDGFIQLDLTDKASIDQAIERVEGGVDVLCNIAGLPPTAPAINVMTVNFVALRYLTENIVGKIKDGGSIINMASLAGVGWPQAVADINQFIEKATFDNVESLCQKLNIEGARSYFFSKEVLVVWTFKNWNTWKDRGIRVNSISPGPIETPILPDFIETLGERAEEDMKVMGRAGKPEEIAPVVAFLCSDESGWVNGTNISTDGGMNAHVMQHIHGL